MVPNASPSQLPPLPPPPRYQYHASSTTPRSATRPHPSSYYAPSPTYFKLKTPSNTADSSTPATPIILHDPRYRTHPAIWCGAFVCLAFSLLLILFGLSTLIVYLVVKPRLPTFDVPSANLTAVYVGSPGYMNGDFSFVANFTNPNERLDVEFKAADLQLAFEGRIIAAGEVVEGFELRHHGGRKVGVVRMISSLVILPLEVAIELQRKVASNRVEYEVRGRFWVKAKLASGLGYSYWLRARCLLQMTAPPGGVLTSSSPSTTPVSSPPAPPTSSPAASPTGATPPAAPVPASIGQTPAASPTSPSNGAALNRAAVGSFAVVALASAIR
ncbi:hypothetical protein V2J09_015159 [Rumex salicifolius]